MWSSAATVFLHLRLDTGRFDGGGPADVLIPTTSAYRNVIIIISVGKVLLRAKSK